MTAGLSGRFKEKYEPECLEKKDKELSALARENHAAIAADPEERSKLESISIESDLYYIVEASMCQAFVRSFMTSWVEACSLNLAHGKMITC